MDTAVLLFDKEAFMAVLDNDEELLREIVADYLVDSQQILQDIAELFVSAEHKDDYEIRRLAHTLKGSSANVHATQMREAAVRFEHAITPQQAADLTELRTKLAEFAAHVRRLGLVN